MNQNLAQLTAKVAELEGKPAKRWESVVLALVGAAARAVATMILSKGEDCMLKNCVLKANVDTKEWFKAAGVRAVKTMAQTLWQP